MVTSFSMLGDALDEAEKNYDALVIANDGDHFGAGANLMLVVTAAKQGQWDQIDHMVSELQKNLQRVRYSSVPVVTAPFQFTFGGGAEIAMAGDATQAHAETYIGLVEVGAGLIPAGTGCLRMVERWTGEARQGRDRAVAAVPGGRLYEYRYRPGGDRC